MSYPSNTKRDHLKIGETILLCVRKLLEEGGEASIARLVVLGAMQEAAERAVTTALQEHGDRMHYVRAFGHEEERRLWESRLGPVFPAVRPRLLPLDQDVFSQGFGTGHFDLGAAFELADTRESGADRP